MPGWANRPACWFHSECLTPTKEEFVHAPRTPAGISRFIVVILISTLVAMTWFGSGGSTVALWASDPAVFPLGLNPGLAPGKPFACPAIQSATASISVTNLV